MTVSSTAASRLLLSFLVLVLLCIPVSAQERQQPQQQSDQQEVRGAPAETLDAQDTRAQIALLEKLQPHFPDRGAILYYLAAAHQHLGETLEATKLLKECIALGEGFDPSGDPEFAALHASREFTELVEKVRRDFPAVAQAHLALSPKRKISFRKVSRGTRIAKSFI